MEFVSIPCDIELTVAGIMCIKGGNIFSRNGPLYRLTHVKLKAKDSQLVNNATNNSFTIDTLYEARFQGKSPPRNQGSSQFPLYYDNLDQDAQSKYYHFHSKYMEQSWIEDIQSCSNSREGADLCDLLWPYNETGTNNMQKMTLDMALTRLDRDIECTSLSVCMSSKGMLAFKYCREGVFDGKQCIRLLRKLPDATSAIRDNLCHRLSNGSHLYVYAIDDNLDTLKFLLQRLDSVSAQAACRDELGNIIVLFLMLANYQLVCITKWIQSLSMLYAVCNQYSPCVHLRTSYVTMDVSVSALCVIAKLTVTREKMSKTAVICVKHLTQLFITVGSDVTHRTARVMNCISSAHLEVASIVLESAMETLTASTVKTNPSV